MVRPVGGSSSSRRAAPSAQEMLNAIGRDIFGDDFQNGLTVKNKKDYDRITGVMFDDDQSMDYYDEPTSYRNLAGKMKKNDTLRSRPFYEVIDLNTDLDIPSNLKVPGYKGPQLEEDTSPANLTISPTSTTNPARPRTVAAGYDEDEEKVTVMFRDGTLYNYYEVDENEWSAFKANRSKGAIIAQLLDFKPRGEAGALSAPARQAFYRYSRGAQIASKGKAKGQTKTTYKTIAQSSRGKNPSTGGKNSRGR